jgi:hypothetical protein
MHVSTTLGTDCLKDLVDFPSDQGCSRMVGIAEEKMKLTGSLLHASIKAS